MNFATCWFAAALVAAGTAGGGSPEDRFAQAQAIFDEAKDALHTGGDDSIEGRKGFHEAASRFAALARDGVRSANLCVNAGNAYHFAGDDPRALLWYLRAQRLSNTPEVRQGVAALRRACGADPWPHPRGSIGRALMFWHYDLSRHLKQRILLATYPLGCLMVIAGLFVRRPSLWRRLGMVLIVVGAAIGLSDVAAGSGPAEQWAVVLEHGKGYAGDGEGYSVVVDHVLPAQEVKVIESRPRWLRVELPSGTTCWLPAETCQRV